MNAVMLAAEVVLSLVALPVLAASAYLVLLTALSAAARPPPPAPPRLRFDVVVPAHDEEAGIGETLRSLAALSYPAALFRTIVVADNCADATAARAREAGATVLERFDEARRGKGHALALAFARSAAEGFADAVVVVDADTVVSPNLLLAFAARLEGGAAAIQARYAVRNPDASWRTRLMAIAFTLFHDVRSLARERLGCSAGLRGNGMCFAASTLREVPYDAFSVVEDLEYGLRLGRAGRRVRFAGEASVLSDMVPDARASVSQRRRWEGGRLEMVRREALPLLGAGLARRDRVLLDLAADLLVPPLAYLFALAAAGAGAAALGSWAAGRPLLAGWAYGASLAGLALHVGRGWWLSGTGLAGLGALVRAPLYLAWKLGAARQAPGEAPRAWVRTARGGRA